MTVLRSYSSAFKTELSPARPIRARAANPNKEKRFMICFPSWGRSRDWLMQVRCRRRLVHEYKDAYVSCTPGEAKTFRGSFYIQRNQNRKLGKNSLSVCAI